ncbi:putative permease [Corynebacterium uterequi]|uniref:Putative permease n=1 Tax=Corynebacterium uterequi TaxID=1072256 RepID=A0A0G3HH31_9CORY|nr:putative permease [Corynebacterium uterequi]
MGVLQGFVIVIAVIAVGFVLAWRGTLGPGARKSLASFVFAIATPALLFDKLTQQTLGEVFSGHFAVVSLSSLAVGLMFFLLCRLLLRHRFDEAVIAMLGSSYANGGNIGIPLAVYILDDASAVIPLMLFQIAFYAPVALTAIDISRASGGWLGNIVAAVKNPMLLGSLAGLAFVVAGVTPPAVIAEPVRMLAGASVPLALVVFGMSLYGARVRVDREVALGAVFKNLIHPVVAGALAAGVFGMEGAALQTAIMLGALPSAQNVYTYAVRYRAKEDFARDIGVVTTIAALPVMVTIAVAFG